ncbi:Lrp/AsnC family transcriptional regulator [Amycolatopsis sp. NPDC047767]|uniref:Lrp/AsnC family transcriptional regulator n=1 Tax=Amycolatopsis sp. NPDC047767 TaxID=3156765 RepID=UPI003451327F
MGDRIRQFSKQTGKVVFAQHDLDEDHSPGSSTALVRVRALRDSGVISGYHAQRDSPSGRPDRARDGLRPHPPPSRKVIAGFREWAIQLPETLNMFVTTGGWDFLIHVAGTGTGTDDL